MSVRLLLETRVGRCEEVKEIDCDVEQGGLKAERKKQEQMTPSGATGGTAAREAGKERAFFSPRAPSASQITKPPFPLPQQPPRSLCLTQRPRATS